MMQIIVTIALQPFGKNLEVKDFLSRVNHSPEWIGTAEDWEIRSIHVHKDKQDKSQITALLENPNWAAPEVKALTGNEVYDAIKGKLDRTVKLATISGVKGITSISDRLKLLDSSFGLRNGYKVLIFDDHDRIQETKGSQIIEHIGREPEPEDAMAFASWKMGEETRKDIAAKPIAIQIGNRCEIAYPLTSVRYKDNKLILIYNQDIEI